MTTYKVGKPDPFGGLWQIAQHFRVPFNDIKKANPQLASRNWKLYGGETLVIPGPTPAPPAGGSPSAPSAGPAPSPPACGRMRMVDRGGFGPGGWRSRVNAGTVGNFRFRNLFAINVRVDIHITTPEG